MGQTFKDGMNISDDHKFKLCDQPPERLCILRTPENAEIINKWINSKAKETFIDYVLYLHYPAYLTNELGDHYLCGYIKEGYTLITDDQFKRWFVKEDKYLLKDQQSILRTTCEDVYKDIRAYIYKPKPIDIMEKELSIGEKKKIYEILPIILKAFPNYNFPMDYGALKYTCAPLFLTSIDNVPIWEGDKVYWINLQGAIILGKAINNFKELRPREETASTCEACEQWIADNRSISVKDVYEMFDKWHSEYNSNTNYIEWIHKFKFMIEKKLKEISK